MVRFPLCGASHFVVDPIAWNHVADLLAYFTAIERTTENQFHRIAAHYRWDLNRACTSNRQVAINSRITVKLPRRLQCILARGSGLLAHRWKGETDGLADTSNSGIAQSIASIMAKLHFQDDQIASALKHWLSHRNSEKAHRPEWLATTIARARQ